MSIIDVIEYFYPFCKGMKCLKEEDCRFLIIMDSFDCYQAPLPWKVSHLHTHLRPIHNYLRNHIKLKINSTLLTTQSSEQIIMRYSKSYNYVLHSMFFSNMSISIFPRSCSFHISGNSKLFKMKNMFCLLT